MMTEWEERLHEDQQNKLENDAMKPGATPPQRRAFNSTRLEVPDHEACKLCLAS